MPSSLASLAPWGPASQRCRVATRFALLFFVAACGTDVDLGGGAPTSGDGAVILQCGDLVAPQVDAGCRACTPSSTDCQANGCYGGYWCNVTITDCHTPPKTCP